MFSSSCSETVIFFADLLKIHPPSLFIMIFTIIYTTKRITKIAKIFIKISSPLSVFSELPKLNKRSKKLPTARQKRSQAEESTEVIFSS